MYLKPNGIFIIYYYNFIFYCILFIDNYTSLFTLEFIRSDALTKSSTKTLIIKKIYNLYFLVHNI
jgi:hypothetical protein